jgi:predicted metal-dependent hydrolase
MMELRPPINGQTREIQYGSERIIYDLEQDELDSLRITVFPELRVRVKAPLERTPEEVDAKVRKRAAWIIKQKEFFQQFLPTPPERRYVSGESHYYLGRQYRLKVYQTASEDTVKLKGRYLEASVPDKNDQCHVGDILQKWYRNHAHQIFPHHLDQCVQRVEKYGIKKPKLRIQRMTKRWGSYTSSNTMILNIELIKAPIHCIDYVIIHELCHSVILNHGPEFDTLLTRCLPDWKKLKERLERVVIT